MNRSKFDQGFIRGAKAPFLAFVIAFSCASAFAGGITPVIVLKCAEAPQNGARSDDHERPLAFKMVIFEKDVEGPGAGRDLRTTFSGRWDGLRIRAEGVTSRIGYTPNHKSVFETTFPDEKNDMRFIRIRFASGTVPWSAVEQSVLIAPPLGNMPAVLPLRCTQKPSFR